jgi:exopolysaccharide biosynthesis polyprenyl glycosylphosphotransferase
MKSNASLIYNFSLVIGDFLALVAAFVGAFLIRAQSHIPVPHPIAGRTYFFVFLGLLPFWILIFALLGLYSTNIYEKRFRETGRLFIGSFIGLLFVIFWNFLSVKPIFPAKLVPFYGFALAFIFLVILRNIARLIRTELFGFKIGLTKVLIVGNTDMTHELVRSLADSRSSGYQIIGVVTGIKHKDHPEHILAYDDFAQFLAGAGNTELHGIIQTELYKDEGKNREVLEYAQEHHTSYRFIPGNTELFVGNIDVELFRNSVPVIAVRLTPLFGWGRIVKRLTDMLLGGMLLIFSSPLWIIIALLVKIGDPKGPVFYKATRLTRFGTTISIFKFRTMKHAYNGLTPEEGFRKMGKPELATEYRKNGDQLAKDPRVSTMGRFLRATSLDELPQLLNVVRGDISLVGPRALDVFEMEQYSKKNLILSVKSGLTGLAVVSGREGISFDERRKLDLYYVQNWSFWLDITILAKTIRVVLERLSRRGARY